MGIHASDVRSVVITGDTAVKAAPGHVFWVSLSEAAGTARLVELMDYASDGGTCRWQITIPANGCQHFTFDPPIECQVGIFFDIAGTVQCAVGYK